MEMLYTVALAAAVVVAIYVLIKILSAPIKKIFKLLINTLLGFVLLWLLNFFGGGLGISLDLTLLNALIVGLLGIPGVLLLLALQLFF